MVYIQPWDKESKRLLQGLSKFHNMYTENKNISSAFGRRHKDIIGEYIDISTTSYRRKSNKTIISRRDDVVIVPKKGKYFFYKI